MRISSCPSCGASIPPGAGQCEYCHQFVIPEPSGHRGELGTQAPAGEAESSQPDRPPKGAPRAQRGAAGVVFRRVPEPNESAFTVLVPDGWLIEGGIMRANLMHQVVDAQSIEAKLDLTVKRDPAASVAIRWCPEIK